MTKGTLVRWLKKEGDFVKPGQILFEVETDKATLGFELQDENYVAKLLVAEGTEDLSIGTPVAVLVSEQEDIAAFKDYVAQSAAPAQAKVEAQPKQEPTHHSDVKIWPAARLLLDQNQINPETIKSKNRVITKEDALAAISSQQASAPSQKPQPTAQTPPPQAATSSQAKKGRQIVPRFSVTSDIALDQTSKLAEVINKIAKSQISVQDFLLKSAAQACIDVSPVNASWTDTSTRIYDDVYIKYITKGASGLTTSYLPAVNTKRLSQISELRAVTSTEALFSSFEVVALTESETVKYVKSATPEYACILTLGKSFAAVVPSEDGVKTLTFVRATLNCDHRVVDGAVGARWLERFKFYVENPALLL